MSILDQPYPGLDAQRQSGAGCGNGSGYADSAKGDPETNLDALMRTVVGSDADDDRMSVC